MAKSVLYNTWKYFKLILSFDEVIEISLGGCFFCATLYIYRLSKKNTPFSFFNNFYKFSYFFTKCGIQVVKRFLHMCGKFHNYSGSIGGIIFISKKKLKFWSDAVIKKTPPFYFFYNFHKFSYFFTKLGIQVAKRFLHMCGKFHVYSGSIGGVIGVSKKFLKIPSDRHW